MARKKPTKKRQAKRSAKGGKRLVQRIVTTTERAVFAGMDGVKAVAGIGGGLFAVGAIGGLAWYFWPRDGASEEVAPNTGLPDGESGQPATGGKPYDPTADAAAATQAFALATAAASAAAVATNVAFTPYVGAATPVVVGAWQALSTIDKANIWTGKTSGVAGLFGLGAVSKTGGAGRVFNWAVSAFIKALRAKAKELGALYCSKANALYKKLKAAGAAVPSQSKWDGLSCDQKIAFTVALGPLGLTMLISGSLVGGWATDAAGQFKKYGGDAAKSIGSAGSNLVSSVGDAAKKYNPF